MLRTVQSRLSGPGGSLLEVGLCFAFFKDWVFPVLFHPFNEGPKVRLLNIKRRNGEVKREAAQPRARQRHLSCGEPPATRIMMSGLGLHP